MIMVLGIVKILLLIFNVYVCQYMYFLHVINGTASIRMCAVVPCASKCLDGVEWGEMVLLI